MMIMENNSVLEETRTNPTLPRHQQCSNPKAYPLDMENKTRNTWL